MKRLFAISALVFSSAAFAQDAAVPKPEAKPEVKPAPKPEAKPEAKPVIKLHKQSEYLPPPPMDDMAWAMQFDKNHDGVLDENEKTALEEGWKLRQQKFSEFRQWEREFRENGYKAEREFQQRQEKDRQEFQERRRAEYLEACKRFGVPLPKEELRKEGYRKDHPIEKGTVINKGELKIKEGKPEGIKAAPMPE